MALDFLNRPKAVRTGLADPLDSNPPRRIFFTGLLDLIALHKGQQLAFERSGPGGRLFFGQCLDQLLEFWPDVFDHFFRRLGVGEDDYTGLSALAHRADVTVRGPFEFPLQLADSGLFGRGRFDKGAVA
jgi:hypothetical protein